MQWTPAQLLEKQSPKQTKKGTGKKAIASNAINKAISQGTAQAKRHTLEQQKPQTPPKLPVLSPKPSQKRLQPLALPPRSVNSLMKKGTNLLQQCRASKKEKRVFKMPEQCSSCLGM